MDTLPHQRGEVILRKEIDFEQVEGYSFVVDANDGRKNDSATVNVTLININGTVLVENESVGTIHKGRTKKFDVFAFLPLSP